MIDERSDAEILGAMPDFVSIPTMLKSHAREEGGERCLYIEASNEDVDHQGEVVLQKALTDSKDYFLRHGNIDLSHYTLLGPKHNIPNFLEYEIGRPVEVRTSGKSTFVKAQLYKGEGARARNADLVWDSLTKQNPPSPWFASVGGGVLAKAVREDPLTKARVGVVTAVRWNNLALDRMPVNRTVGNLSLAPIGAFAKSMGGFVFAKSDAAPAGLVAGYGTDSAALEGGAALRTQSLDRKLQSYWDFRDRLASDVRAKRVRATPEALTAHASRAYGLPEGQGAEWVGRFLGDLNSALTKPRKN